jgi:hypothetical protein
MSTPAEVVAEAFATARSYANDAETKLLSFTTALNEAVQAVPLVDVVWDSIAAPTALVMPAYVEPGAYSSSLLTALTDEIVARLAGGTGLAPAVEAALWDRARERELTTMQAAIDQITGDSEALGFMLPSGVLFDAISRETRNYHDKVSALSREIAIEQARLEQANAQKTVDQGMQLEGVVVDIEAKRAATALAVLQGKVEVVKAQVDQDVKRWEIGIKQYEAIATYSFNTQKMNGEIIRANSSAALDAAKVGAQVYAQLTASAYSLIHASASVSAGSSNSVSYSYSNDTATAPASVTAI